MWDPTGTSIIWVRVPEIAGREQSTVLMRFGDPNAVDTSQPNGAFTADYVGVFHFASDMLKDSSPQRDDGANRSSMDAEGNLGRGRLFQRGGVVISDDAFPQGLEPRTVCLWNRSDDDGNAFYWMFGIGSGADDAGGFMMGRHGTQYECLGGDGSRESLRDVYPPGDRSWRYMCCKYDGTAATLYTDGLPIFGPEPHDWLVTRSTAQIGTAVNPDGSGRAGGWIGAIDEVRISTVARSDDWIAAEHASMSRDFVSLGPIEQLP